MTKTVLKTVGFLAMVVLIIFINVQVFRSELPMYWILTALGGVIFFILFPYKKYFNN